MNQVVLRTDLGSSMTFGAALAQVRDVVLEAMVHRAAPVQGIVDSLGGNSRLFRILFGFQTYHLPSTEGLSFRIKRRETEWNTAKHDLSLMVRQEDGELNALLEYRDDLFDDATARRILSQYQMVLEQAVRNPDVRIDEFSLFSGTREQCLASVFNEALEVA